MDSSSSRSGYGYRSQIFRGGISGALNLNKIQELAVKKPGQLLAVGLQMMQKYCEPGSTVATGPQKESLVPTAVKYYNMCVKPMLRMSPGQEREMRTIAEAIDRIVSGEVALAGDILMQRFKSLEVELTEGSTSVSKHIELLPPSGSSSLTTVEREVAAQLEVRDLRLAKVSGSRR